MPLACGPSGPEFLLILGFIFAVPLISVTATFIGAIRLACRERSVPWVSAVIGVFAGIPGGFMFVRHLLEGTNPEGIEALIQAGPFLAASLLLIGCVILRKKRPRERTV